MCVQVCPMLVCVSAHQTYLLWEQYGYLSPTWLEAVCWHRAVLVCWCQSWDVTSCLLRDLYTQHCTELCRKALPRSGSSGWISSPSSGICPSAQCGVGIKGPLNIQSPSRKSWNNIWKWGVSGLGFAAANALGAWHHGASQTHQVHPRATFPPPLPQCLL